MDTGLRSGSWTVLTFRRSTALKTYFTFVSFVSFNFPSFLRYFLLTFLPKSCQRSSFDFHDYGEPRDRNTSAEESIRFHFLEEQALRNRMPQPVRRLATETVSLAEGTPERKSRFLFSDHVCSPTARASRENEVLQFHLFEQTSMLRQTFFFFFFFFFWKEDSTAETVLSGFAILEKFCGGFVTGFHRIPFLRESSKYAT